MFQIEVRDGVPHPAVPLTGWGAAHRRRHVAGADLKDIQEMLGRSSITITADT
ncbi:hypothetical protein [Streptomyces sp. SD15]